MEGWQVSTGGRHHEASAIIPTMQTRNNLVCLRAWMVDVTNNQFSVAAINGTLVSFYWRYLCAEKWQKMEELMIFKYLLLKLLLNLKLLAIIWTNQNLSSCKWVAIDWKGRRRLTPLQTQVAANSTSCMLSAMTTIKWSTIPYNVKWPL